MYWILHSIYTFENEALDSPYSVLEKQSPAYKQDAIEHIGIHYPDYTYIYTDGSRTQIGRVGASVFIPDHDIELYYRLPDNLSVFTAELDAVYSAISLILQHKILKPLILTDSLRLVRCLGDLAPVFDLELIRYCRSMVTENKVDLTICWVPGHRNLVDHNRADRMAKLGCTLPTVNKNYIRPSVEEGTDILKSYLQNRLNLAIPTSKTGQVYHALFPLDAPNPPVVHPRKKATTISRLRLQSCFLNQYLFKIGLHPDGMCMVCRVQESVEHFLLKCAKHQKLTNLLIEAAGNQGLSPSLSLFLSSEPFLTIIYQYVSSVSVRI